MKFRLLLALVFQCVEPIDRMTGSVSGLL